MNTKPVGVIGLLLVIGGITGLFYFFAVFDVSVPVQKINYDALGLPEVVQTPDRVNNIGLLNTRQNGVIASSVAILIGVALLITHMLTRGQAKAVVQTTSKEADYSWSQETLSKDPHTQWLRDCLRADNEGRPHPPKPRRKDE